MKSLLRAIDQCQEELEPLNGIYWLLGHNPQTVPEHDKLFRQLVEDRTSCIEAVRQARTTGRRFQVNESKITFFRSCRERIAAATKPWKEAGWRTDTGRVALTDFATRVKEAGQVFLTPTEFETVFECRARVSGWERLPAHVRFSFGTAGAGVTLPECELYRAMCDSIDQAILAGAEIERLRAEAAPEGLDWNLVNELAISRRTACLHAVLDASLVVEAFLNSLASIHLSRADAGLSEDDRLNLQERYKNKTGVVREKFVSISDKLTRWIQVISPRGETFEKEREPFLSFMQVKALRDSIVHLETRKLGDFARIDLAAARNAGETAATIIEGACRFTAVKPDEPHLPFWLLRPDPEGMYRYSLRARSIFVPQNTAPTAVPPG